MDPSNSNPNSHALVVGAGKLAKATLLNETRMAKVALQDLLDC